MNNAPDSAAAASSPLPRVEGGADRDAAKPQSDAAAPPVSSQSGPLVAATGAPSDNSVAPGSQPAIPRGKCTKPDSDPARAQSRDRSLASLCWYRFVQSLCATLAEVLWRWRATGQANVPESGGTSTRLQPCQFPGRLLSGNSAAPTAQLRRAIDPVRAGAGCLHPIGRGVSDPARGDWEPRA